MTNRKLHFIIKKYNEFNSRFGDDQFNIKCFKHSDGTEQYVVACGSDIELDTYDVSKLFEYILGEVDYYQNNLSQSEGWLCDVLEHDWEERKAFRNYIKYLKTNCKEQNYD